MKSPARLRPLTLLAAIILMLSAPLASAATATKAIWVLQIDDAIGPATSDYIVRGIDKAQQADASLIVIEIDTPGGLSSSMRDIIAAILASKVPVASYVTPRGARAASAGTYIMYASHFAAMNEATNIGAATPIQIGLPSVPGSPGPQSSPKSGNKAGNPQNLTTEERKMVNDAAAYIRSLAELRGRNATWAERAVREAVSLSATEALKEGVINFIAPDLAHLISDLNNKTVKAAGKEVTLQLAGRPVHYYKPDWRTKLLGTITNPNMVLILGMLGIYGILLEFYHPGSVVPGTVGVISLILAGYALQMLPVDYAGLGLIVLGIGLMVAEAMAPTFGVMGIGGVISFTIGGIMLFNSDMEAFRVGLPAIIAVATISAVILFATVNIALKMRRKPATTGIDRIVGSSGQALTDIGTKGQVRIGGEIWKATAPATIVKGTRIRVTAVNGMVLTVEAGQEDT